MGVPPHRGAGSGESGSAAVEFGIVAPFMLLVLVAATDLSGMLYTGFRLDATVSAAAQFAIVNPDKVNSTSGRDLADKLSKILTNGTDASALTARVTVNNGPIVSSSNGTVSSSGSDAQADSCYCPSRGSDGITWGASVSCGASCSGGTPAGKYVVLTVTKPYVSLFSSWGLVPRDGIAARAVVQVQ
ncbi:TadE/TadG family type IV pilus assembly protein [Methylobacterium sp. ID0610]|uniref:TadE/TadG family type IV pilus assembly protein n=1 Tax=Methylobacterium carpenticola TaxID=3344827 RepID=UPI0036873D45